MLNLKYFAATFLALFSVNGMEKCKPCTPERKKMLALQFSKKGYTKAVRHQRLLELISKNQEADIEDADTIICSNVDDAGNYDNEDKWVVLFNEAIRSNNTHVFSLLNNKYCNIKESKSRNDPDPADSYLTAAAETSVEMLERLINEDLNILKAKRTRQFCLYSACKRPPCQIFNKKYSELKAKNAKERELAQAKAKQEEQQKFKSFLDDVKEIGTSN